MLDRNIKLLSDIMTSKHTQYGMELQPKVYVSCFYSYSADFLISQFIFTCMPLYSFHFIINCSSYFTLILFYFICCASFYVDLLSSYPCFVFLSSIFVLVSYYNKNIMVIFIKNVNFTFYILPNNKQ